MSEKDERRIKKGLDYVQFWIDELLVKCIDEKLSGHAMRLLIYYMSNCNRLTRKSHRIPHTTVMEDLDMSKATLYRAYGALEDAGLLLPPPESAPPIYEVAAIKLSDAAEEKTKETTETEAPAEPSPPLQKQPPARKQSEKPPQTPAPSVEIEERTAERTARYVERVGKKPSPGPRDRILRADDLSFEAWFATLKPSTPQSKEIGQLEKKLEDDQ